MFRPPVKSSEKREEYAKIWADAQKGAMQELVKSLIVQYDLNWDRIPGLPYMQGGPCREIYDLLQEHEYRWGGPCGGCHTCRKIDDGDVNEAGDDWTYEDHFVELLVKKYNLRWKRE